MPDSADPGARSAVGRDQTATSDEPRRPILNATLQPRDSVAGRGPAPRIVDAAPARPGAATLASGTAPMKERT